MATLTDVQPATPGSPSAWRGWCSLVLLSMRRQARAHWLVWVSLALLALTAFLVAINTANARWTMAHWRMPRRGGPTYAEYVLQVASAGQLPAPAAASALRFGVVSSWATVTHVSSALRRFSYWVVFAMFATFLLPLWTLTFATESLGREREAQTLIWTLVRPIPRPAIYLAKYVALLPWCLAFNLGGFFLLCWLGSDPGRLAFRLYWLPALWGTLAFAALFHFLGACVRRSAVVALLYAFFLETVAGNLPGHFKRLSISFYTRCLMFDYGAGYGIGPNQSLTYLPVNGAAAAWVLAGTTLVLLAAGMFVFARSEYLDVK